MCFITAEVLEEVLKHSPLAVLHSDLSQEIRSEVELTLIELFYLLKDITNSKSRFILKKNTPINIVKKYKSLSQVVDIHYTLKDFKKDIVKILKKEMKI